MQGESVPRDSRGPQIRVLLVDDCEDDSFIIRSMLSERGGRGFHVDWAPSFESGLQACRRNEHDICLLDYQLDTETGVELYRRAVADGFDAPMILLSGLASRKIELEAMSAGASHHLDKSLLRPAILERTIRYAIEQHRTLSSERIHLDLTLKASVKTLMFILEGLHCAAFDRAERLRALAAALATHLEAPNARQIEEAARLSQIGCITMPAAGVAGLCSGRALPGPERALVEQIPGLSAMLLESMPGLEPVREILTHAHRSYGGGVGLDAEPRGAEIPLGARLLKVVLDFDLLDAEGLAAGLILDTMRGRRGQYDPAILESLFELRGADTQGLTIQELGLDELCPGMIMGQDLVTLAGLPLIAKGLELTPGLLDRIRKSECVGPQDLLRIILPPEEEEAVTSGGSDAATDASSDATADASSDAATSDGCDAATSNGSDAATSNGSDAATSNGSAALRILLIDDEEDAYLIVRDLLSEIGEDWFDLCWESSYEQGLEKVLLREHDVYLVDYDLGPAIGLDLIRTAIAQGCEAPMILFTGHGGRELDMEAMTSGAADFIDKEHVDARLLERSIRYAVRK